MLAAAIDIGTNSVLLTVAERTPAGDVRVLEDRSQITRLGEGVDQERVLRPEAMDRTAEAVAAFAAQARALGASQIRAVGTSATRDARNAGDFARLLRERAHVDLEILSGEQEALLSYEAVRGDDSLGLPAGDLLVVDIGGGSAEFIYGSAEHIRFRTSLDCGAVRVTERFLHTDPPAPSERDAAERWLQAQLATLPNLPAETPTVGIGGTFVNLASVQASASARPDAGLVGGVGHLHGAVLDRAEVERQIALFAACSVADRRRIPGLEPGRADVILAGALLVRCILDRFGLPHIRVSVRGLRYGLLWEMLGLTPRPAVGE